LTNTITLARNPAYEDDDSELITKATWPLKVSGLLFAGMLVLGRSASYGNISWTPAHHAASTPLVVVHENDGSAPAPAVPKSVPLTHPAALSLRSAADEVIVFSPGSNSDDGEKDKRGKQSGTANDQKKESEKNDRDDHDRPSAVAQGTAHTAHETAQETAGEVTGQQTATAQTVKTANTPNDTPVETNAEATGAAETAIATAATNGNHNGNNSGPNHNGPNNAQGNPQGIAQTLNGSNAAWFARSEESPLVAVGALGGLMTLIGLAFLKPWRFLRKFIR